MGGFFLVLGDQSWRVSMTSTRGRNVLGREEGWANPWTETGEQAIVPEEGGIMNAADGRGVECVSYQEKTVSQRDNYPRMTDRKADDRLGCACGDQLLIISYFNISDGREGEKEKK